MLAEDRLSKTAIKILLREIESAHGNEVLAIGHLNEEGLVTEIDVVSRGDSVSVPALSHFIHQGDVVIHNHPSGNLSPSTADLNIASVLGEQGIGFYIVDNTLKSIYVVSEAVPIRKLENIDASSLAMLLKDKSRLSSILDDFEVRESQAEMLKVVADALNKDKICLIEAGTGVGKSLAYLIPAFEWVKRNGERIVISTATINLQQQVFEKDIEIVKKLTDFDPGVFLIKGRGNYLCRRRLHEAIDELSLFGEEFGEKTDELLAISDWEKETITGDRFDLSFYPSDSTWSSVRSEYDLCLGIKCKWHSNCFVLRARRLAAKSRLLIVNHHLLFSDISMRINGIGFEDPAILPPVNRIFFDEAHSIEESASSFFSESFSFLTISKYLNRIIRKKSQKRGKVKKYGVYSILESKGYRLDRGKIKKIPELKQSILEAAEKLDSIILACINEREEKRSYLFNEILDLCGKDILNLIAALRNRLIEFFEAWNDFFNEIEDENENEYIYECKILVNRLLRISTLCDSFVNFGKENQLVFWIEKIVLRKEEIFIRYITTPLKISDIMQEAVFRRYKTLVFTSATLTINNSFMYWKSRVGLENFSYRPVEEHLFPSPYNFKKNVLFCVPKNVPQPGDNDYEKYISDFISKALLISEGRSLVLFTSYKMLKKTAYLVKEKIEARERGFGILMQGDDDRNKLLGTFKKDISSVLFATDSFWEGIDAPGKSLEMVIICRLPFKVPTEPVIYARMKALEREGENPFFALSLPDAIIKLRQGFGRLIRSHKDKGVIIVLDSRLITKNYGQYFLSSLPQTKRIISEPQIILEEIEAFFVGMKRENEKGAID